MNYAKLFDLGNRAKDYGLYNIANIVFAILFAQTRNNQNPTPWIEWESMDPKGIFPNEVYYDLVYVCWEKFPIVYEICAPAPLIQQNELLAALKRSKAFRENVPHARERREPTSEETARLWMELKQQTSKDDLGDIGSILADTDGQGHGLQIPLLEAFATLHQKE